jgi:glycosyltransferase involved in cell wall biosynthesis
MMSQIAVSNEATVALDVTCVNVNRVGTGIYTAQLMRSLNAIMGARLQPVSFDPLTVSEGTKPLRKRVVRLTHDLWWTQAGVERAARRASASLLHLPVPLGPVHCRLPLVVTIQDIAVLRFPEKFRVWLRYFARLVIPTVARQASVIIAPSLATKADLVNILGIPDERVTCIPNGVGQEFTPLAYDSDEVQRVRARYQLPSRFLFTVGAIEPRKNLVRLLHAVHQLRAGSGTSDLQLLHAGPPGWLAEDVAGTMASLKLHDVVRFLGYVAPEDLPVLYAASTVVIYPSLFEGFGLPVVEALACGAPVITSNTSSLPEVGGDAALLVDPLSIDSIADAIARLWSDETTRAQMSRRGVLHAANYSWERTARETAEVYERVLA